MVIKQLKYKTNTQTRAKINFDIMTYDVFCKYVLQESSFVKMEHLVNLRKMLNSIDRSVYENDPEKVKRINFLYKALDARLENNLNDINIILTYINGGLTFKIDFLDYDHLLLSKPEILYVHKLVSETLQYNFIYEDIDTMQDLCARFKSSDYENRGNLINEFESLTDKMKNEFRHSKVNGNSTDMTFSLRNGVFENAVTDTWNLITNPSRRLRCAMQGLNELIGGGFESGRVYMLIGSSGVGKSITLLNLINQIKRANCNYKAKDPTKTPCIVLLTMENTVVETITRLFDLVIENSQGMENYSVNDVINLLRTEGELFLNDSSPIDIVIRYKANKSVDTSYLYTLADDLEDEGYEMICLVQDHVKRIRSINPGMDLRLELGDIVNEFKVFAAEKDIPVISNTHLNREAAKLIEDAAKKPGSKEIGKDLGRSMIGESLLMIDNLDYAMIINIDYDDLGTRYMTFKSIKTRVKISREYIAQPFAPGSTIRLVEDLGSIPVFKESLHEDHKINHKSIIKVSGAASLSNNINNVINMEDEDDNAFNSANIYTLGSSNNNIVKSGYTDNIVLNQQNELNNLKSMISSIKEPNIGLERICPIEFVDNFDEKIEHYDFSKDTNIKIVV